jgi:hypothetical protein
MKSGIYRDNGKKRKETYKDNPRWRVRRRTGWCEAGTRKKRRKVKLRNTTHGTGGKNGTCSKKGQRKNIDRMKATVEAQEKRRPSSNRSGIKRGFCSKESMRRQQKIEKRKKKKRKRKRKKEKKDKE